MRHARWAFVLVLLVAVAAVGIWWFGRSRLGRPTSGASHTPSAPATRPAPPPPLPDLAFEVNAGDRVDAVQGTPLILTVRVSNPRAANASAQNQANARVAELIQQRAQRGEMTTAAAQPMLEAARQAQPIQVVRTGTNDRGWETFLRFERQVPGGRMERLNWPLTLVRTPDSKSVTLDATTTVEVNYALAPQGATQIPTGSYEIVAVYEVPAGIELPAEHWRGRVASRAITVNITPAVAQSSAANQAGTSLTRAEFFATIADWPNALQAAQQALAANPALIRAHIVAGQAYETQGNLQAARSAFLTAKQLFDQQQPNSYEAPEYLIVKIAELDARLGR